VARRFGIGRDFVSPEELVNFWADDQLEQLPAPNEQIATFVLGDMRKDTR
jgi:hypothetical protein